MPLHAYRVGVEILKTVQSSTRGTCAVPTVWLGVPVTVTAPDAATAEIFRAALRETQKERPSDRLIRVELTEPTRVSGRLPSRGFVGSPR